MINSAHLDDGPETDILSSSSSDTSVRHLQGPMINETNGDAEFDDASSVVSEDDPEALELIERELIVERYEKGPEQKDVDEWENPNLELYKITDQHGFMHKNAAIEETEKKQRKADRQKAREKKWVAMWLAIDAGNKPPKLQRRIWKTGIPDNLRYGVWKHLLEVPKRQPNNDPKVAEYNELLRRAHLLSRDIKQIDLDINRTYRDHIDFRKRYDIKQKSLFNVLAAYAMYNTEVGYCQGMSQVAALLLMYMDESDAFWSLHQIMVGKRCSMHGFFVPGFPKLMRFQNHYELVLGKYLPKVKKHLDKASIPPIYLTKWWFGCFLDRVPFRLALRIWDIFLLEGDVVLIAFAYNIMKMHQKKIRQLQMENFMEFIQSDLANDFGYTDQQVMDSLSECLKKLQSDGMALPAPPLHGSIPEMPTRPMGPILSRSMADIRYDIDDIKKRSSRANSTVGNSPAMSRRLGGTNSLRNAPPPPGPPAAGRLVNTVTGRSPVIVAGRSPVIVAAGGPRAALSPMHQSLFSGRIAETDNLLSTTSTSSTMALEDRYVECQSPPHIPEPDYPGANSENAMSTYPGAQENAMSTSFAFGQKPPIPKPRLKPPIATTTTTGRPPSIYDNVPLNGSEGELVAYSSTSNHQFERKSREDFAPGADSTLMFESKREETKIQVETRVRRTANNVTYVTIGDPAPPINRRRLPEPSARSLNQTVV